MKHSNSPISIRANRFLNTNELLSIKPVLRGVDWIPLGLRALVNQFCDVVKELSHHVTVELQRKILPLHLH